MRNEYFVQLTFKFKKEGKKWSAYCEELGTSTYANKIEEAKERIKEAVLLHLNTLEELGERERFFKENKIELLKCKPKRKNISFSAPISSDIYTMPYIQPIAKKYLNL